MEKHDKDKDGMISATAKIVAGYASHHKVEDLADLIREVYATLSTLGSESKNTPAAARAEPAVPVNKSVMPDYIICLEDGKKMKMLKRYLKATYDMTPEAYREKWGLPVDYPMVAPNYAAKRSHLAKKSGLGKDRK